MDTKKLAQELAGNWKKFDSFVWDRRYELDNPDLWGIVYTHNRDSSLLEESNAQAIEEILSPYIARGDILKEWHNHWAVGYVCGYAIKVFTTRGKITKAFLAWLDITSKLDDYPLLNEDDYYQRVYESQLEGINQQSWGLDTIDNLPDDWKEQVYSWLSDNGYENELDNESSWPSKESIAVALSELEFLAK